MAMATRFRADTPSDLVLLLLYAGRLQGQQFWSGITRLQKVAYLATEEPAYAALAGRGEAPALEFEAYKMGPFTPDIYEAVDTLTSFEPPLVDAAPGSVAGQDEIETQRYIDEVDPDEAIGAAPRPNRFTLTSSGTKVGQRLWEDANPELREVISGLVRRFGRMPLRDLLRYVYLAHPEKTTRSEIKGQLGL
jgi:hypothetical protein